MTPLHLSCCSPLKSLAFFHDEVRGETTQMLKANDLYFLYNGTDLCSSVETRLTQSLLCTLAAENTQKQVDGEIVAKMW